MSVSAFVMKRSSEIEGVDVHDPNGTSSTTEASG